MREIKQTRDGEGHSLARREAIWLAAAIEGQELRKRKKADKEEETHVHHQSYPFQITVFYLSLRD